MTNDNQWNSEPPFQGQSNPPHQNPGSEQGHNVPLPPNQSQGQFSQQQSSQPYGAPQQPQQNQQQYQNPQFQNGAAPGGYPPPPAPNNNKLWIILGSVFVAVVGLGIAAFFLIGGLLGGDSDTDKPSDVKPTQEASQSATSKPTEDYIPVPDKIEDEEVTKEVPFDNDLSPYPNEWSSPAIKDYKPANGTTDDDFIDMITDKLKHENGAITSSEMVSIPKNICYALDNGQTVNQVFINWVRLGQDQSISSSDEDLGYNIGVLSAAGAMTYCPDHVDAIKKAVGR